MVFLPPVKIQALAYVVAALDALTSGEYGVSVKDRCYNQARELLDLCERQDNGSMLANINTLQTCVLLALYEFKSPNFPRLWMMLGRAIRLCKMMGVDMLDVAPEPSQPPQPPFLLPPTSGPAELEERRRTFWILCIFDVSAAVRSPSAVPAFDAGQLPVHLPGTGNIAEVYRDSKMPLLQHLDSLPAGFALPPLAGTVVIGYLYRRILEHVHLPQQDDQKTSPPYAFWVTHYYLDRLLLGCRVRASQEQPSAQGRVLHLTMQCNLAAIGVLLHGAALAKAESESHLPAVLRTEATLQCVAAAARVHEVIVQAKQLGGTEKDSHRLSGEFFIWPIASAIAILRMRQARALAEDQEAPSACPDSIQALTEALRDLVTPDLIPDGVLDEPDSVAGDGVIEGLEGGGANVAK
ncbi:hypothetical protein OQA88_11864 [Cercophora sp. LCS_1]